MKKLCFRSISRTQNLQPFEKEKTTVATSKDRRPSTADLQEKRFEVNDIASNRSNNGRVDFGISSNDNQQFHRTAVNVTHTASPLNTTRGVRNGADLSKTLILASVHVVLLRNN